MIFKISDLSVPTFIYDSTGAYNTFDIDTDGRFIYVADGAGDMKVFTISNAGILTRLDNLTISGSARSVVCHKGFVLFGVSSGVTGLHCYSVDDSGQLSAEIDSVDSGISISALWSDGNFIYGIGSDLNGLRVYSLDTGGNITLVDSDNQGIAYSNVHGNDDFIFVVATGGKLLSYSRDVSGNLTYKNEVVNGGGNTYTVFVKNEVVYTADVILGLYSYSYDSTGDFTQIDLVSTATQGRGLFVDDFKVYLGRTSLGVQVYSTVNGEMTLIGSHNQDTNTPYAIISFGSFLLLGNSDDGLMSYTYNLLELLIEWSSTKAGNKLQSQIQTIGGTDFSYQWVTFNVFGITARNVPSADAAIINQWWLQATELQFEFDGNIYFGYLANPEQPFMRLSNRYFNEFDGVLQLSK